MSSDEPEFLDVEDVIEIHATQLDVEDVIEIHATQLEVYGPRPSTS